MLSNTLGFVLLVTLASAALTGCTQVTVYAPEGVSVHSSIGVTRVEAPRGSYIETRGAGIVFGQSRVAVGWMEETQTLLGDPKACQVVIVTDNPDQFAGIRSVLHLSSSDLSRICLPRRAKT